ncbi:DUF5320 domain-containing protein [Candidatus Aerophobetes bacterium]|nr:DUF5320 domain-containing protein [Candidatus Aerophobetes bacterium]
MPRGDGTGPMGMGPMTGRAAGYCAGFPTPGFINPIGGRLGLGLGRGRGFRSRAYYGWGRTPLYYNPQVYPGYGVPYRGFAQPYGYYPPRAW